MRGANFVPWPGFRRLGSLFAIRTSGQDRAAKRHGLLVPRCARLGWRWNAHGRRFGRQGADGDQGGAATLSRMDGEAAASCHGGGEYRSSGHFMDRAQAVEDDNGGRRNEEDSQVIPGSRAEDSGLSGEVLRWDISPWSRINSIDATGPFAPPVQLRPAPLGLGALARRHDPRRAAPLVPFSRRRAKRRRGQAIC